MTWSERPDPIGGEARVDPREFLDRRERMVDTDIAGRGIRDPWVLHAVRTVPREAFVPAALRHSAYDDCALPISAGQTISQPYIVALMTAAVRPAPGNRALEIGTGTGYAAAVLGTIVATVHTVERLGELASSAERRLAHLGYRNVHVLHGDGTLGWEQHAPYDVIIVTAAGPTVPLALREQLAIGGRLVMPVGSAHRLQHLVRVTRRGRDDYVPEDLDAVAFVPLVGAQGWRDEASAM